MKEKNLLIKEAVKFSEPIDFNFISKLMDRNNFESSLSSNWMNLYILNSVFKINGIQKTRFLKNCITN
jgi:hypothetical protein